MLKVIVVDGRIVDVEKMKIEFTETFQPFFVVR